MRKIGACLVLVFVCLGIFGAWIAPYDPQNDVGTALARPSSAHWLGTDDVGRDILSQAIVGTRISLIVGLTAGLAATCIGVLVGILAGYSGGWVDNLLMRGVDLFLVLPRFPLLVLIAAYLGGGLLTIAISFVLLSWALPARMIRSQVLLERKRSYVISAQLSRVPTIRLIRRHILPALVPLIQAATIMEMSHAIMAEAGLSFLGLGDPTAISWGTILHFAFVYPALFLGDAWLWWALPPGLCLSLYLVGLAFLGVSFEKSVDPRLEGAG